MMESLPSVLSPIPPLLNPPRTYRPNFLFSKYNSISRNLNSHQIHFLHTRKATLISRAQNTKPHQNLLLKNSTFPQNLAKTQLSFATIELLTSLPCFAAETVASNEQVSDRINLESILVSIDEFFNKYPFFVAGCTFIYLVVIPLAQYYFRKYKFVYAIDAFRKLKDDPNAQLLDIRDRKSLALLGSPDLKIYNKGVVQVEYTQEDEDRFVKNVLENFSDPANTIICILDNSDENSIKVAELLSKNGFKEAFAIKGGVKGKKGWLAIQGTLLPPSLHMSRKKTAAKISQKLETNGGVVQQSEKHDRSTSSTSVVVESERNGNKSTSSTPGMKICSRSSPYPNYPDLKPPTSPTPSKPQN